MFHNFIASIVLATSLFAVAPSTFSNTAPKIARLRTLFMQQPWDKQRLQEIVAVNLTHDYLLAKKPRHWLFGTVHHLTFANFAQEARLQLEHVFAVQNAYLTADISAIMRAINNDGIESAAIASDTNYRNHLWLDRIVTQCEQNTNCLIVAGMHT